MANKFSDTELDGFRRGDGINDLDCVIPGCGRWFRNFDLLAAHMHARHGSPTPNQPGDVELPKATRTRPAFVPVTERVESVAKRRTSGGKLPPPASAGANNELNPFIKVEDVGDIGDTAVFAFTGDNRLGTSNFDKEQIICEVSFGGKTWDWGINLSSPNYRLLFDKFGDDIDGWKGKVNVVVKQGTRSPFIAVAKGRARA